MKTAGMHRMMNYFVRQTELYVLTAAAGSLAMAVFIWLMNADGSGLQEMFSYMPSGVMYMSLVILFGCGMSSNQYSILIAFGCRRIDAFTGTLAGNLLFIAQCMILYVCSLFGLQKGDFYVNAWTILAVCLILEGTSKLLGIIAVRWGKVAYILLTVIIVIISMFFGFWAGYAGYSGKTAIKIPFAAVIGGELKWQILAGGILTCVLTNLAAYRMLRKFEVKA